MRRRLRLGLDLLGLGLLFVGLAIAAAVFSYNPTDLSGSRPANLLGAYGDEIASDLNQVFGVAVYGFLGFWFVLVLTLLLTGRKGEWSWRVLGWLVLVPSLALGAHCLGSEIMNGPAIGPGGLLGASLHAFALQYLTQGGVFLVAVAGLVGGLGLTADFLWPKVFRLLGKWLQRSRERRVAQKLQALERKAMRRAVVAQPPPAVLPNPDKLTLKTNAATSTAPRAVHVQEIIPIRPLMPEPPQVPEDVQTTPAPAEAFLAFIPAEPVAAEPQQIEEEPATAVAAPPAPPPPVVKRPAPMPIQLPANNYKLPPFDLLEDPEPFPYEEHDQQLRDRGAKLEKTFTDFDLNVRVVGINTGPVITQYEVALETGLRLHKVTRLADDLALNLKVPSVRMVAPIPGKDTVGVEIPNEHRAVVRLKEVILNAGPKLAKSKVPLFLGKDTEGRPLIYDLAEMPHLLIAGRTGTGKSVCMNTIILSILMTRRPDEVRMIMIDPKMLELSEYGKIPHLMHSVVKDMKKAEAILSWVVDKMEERYDILSRARVRSIASYNELSPEEIYRRVKPVDDDERARIPERMPYIVVFVDEMNDLMMTMRKEVEGHIIRLAQKSRAAGIHLVVATQKPTVDVITGLIKSNLPARICFQVSSRSDSRVVLDEMGAEKLLGKGDLLFLQPGTSTIIRAQGAYASDQEISQVVEYLEAEPAYPRELIQLKTSSGKDKESTENPLKSRDELYEQAIEIVVREQRGSVSLLQRALGIGYGRAARLVDFMAEDGFVGPYNGSNAREVILTAEQWEKMKESQSTDAA